MKNSKLKVVFFGTPDFVLPVPMTLLKNFDFVAVITTPDKKVGRKQILTPSPVKSWAKSHHIPVFTPEKLDQDFSYKLQAVSPELIIVASYGKIIPQNILDIPKFGALNIHPSLLPKYRGPSPIQAAILNGDKTSGISIIKMDAKMDHGPVIYTKEFSLSNLDNFQTLSTNMFGRSAKILPEIITAFISGKLTPRPQDEKKVTYCKLITKEDGYFDPPVDGETSKDFSKKLDKMIRAFYPWPTAWCKWSGKMIKLLPNQMIQMEGKKPAKLADFLRGYPDFPLKNLPPCA